MGVDKAGKLSLEELVDGQPRTFFQMQGLAGYAIGVNHPAAALQKDVARQCFEERLLLGRKDGNISFCIHR